LGEPRAGALKAQVPSKRKRRAGARRGSESEEGIRLAVEPLWSSREPVAKPDPEQAEATWGLACSVILY